MQQIVLPSLRQSGSGEASPLPLVRRKLKRADSFRLRRNLARGLFALLMAGTLALLAQATRAYLAANPEVERTLTELVH